MRKGFTLIELLVVIAIIGILSGIFMISLQGARKKAKDARIIADLAQVRVRAETLYNGSYPSNMAQDSEIQKLANDINSQGGQFVMYNNANAWCASSRLVSKNAYYCIDSSGASKETTSACSNSTYQCP